MLSLFRKINRGSVKGLCENTTPDKIRTEKGDMPKGDDSRSPFELWNERDWGSRGIHEDSDMERLRDGMLR